MSAEEVIDLVDRQDIIIGESTRKTANKNPDLIHREVAVIIYDDKGRVLFQQRSKNKSVHPLFWTVSAAGWVPKGEELEKTAHRELKEELGFDTKLEFIDKSFWRQENQSQFYYLYKGRYAGEKITPDPGELEDIKWVTKEEAQVMVKRGEKVGESSIELLKRFW